VAVDGDTIDVAAGKYRDNIALTGTHNLSFLGGWDTTFAARDPMLTPSVIRARYGGGTSGRVWTVQTTGTETLDATIDGFTLMRGRALGGGLGVFADAGTLTLTVRETTITGNASGKNYGGGGVMIGDDGSSATVDVTFDRVVVTGNNTIGGGAGIEFVGGGGGLWGLTLMNCLIVNNGSGGPGVEELGGKLEIDDSTITGNHGGVESPAFGGFTTLRDTIAWNNTQDVFVGNGASITIDHNDIENGSWHTVDDQGGNVSVDPQLSTDFELEATSPLIDAGTCVATIDFEGDPRPSGATCDIGADEFQF